MPGKAGRKGYPAQIWVELKAEYESGKYGSLEKVREAYAATHEKCPGIDSIKQRAAKEKWREKLEEAIVESKKMVDKFTAQMFADNNLPPEKVVQEVAKVILGKEPAAVKKKYIDLYLDMTGMKAPVKKDITSDGKPVRTVLILPQNGFEAKLPEEVTPG